jgi:prepilin-type processing-associated H-X9-DG protein
MRISDQTLLAYLLGGLEGEHSEQIRLAMADDPALAQRLVELKRWLGPLPPPGILPGSPDEPLASQTGQSLVDGLADRTLAAIWGLESDASTADRDGVLPAATPNEANRNGPSSPHSPPTSFSAREFPSEVGGGAASPLRRRWFSFGQTSDRDTRSAGLWRSPDLLALAVAAVVMLGLLLPNLQSARELARSASCGDHLRQLGMALGAFAERDPKRCIPAIDPVGPMSFAGIYASQLESNQLLDDAAWLLCPGQPAAQRWVGRRPPTINQLLAAREGELLQLQRIAGGSFAYNLGVWRAPHYQPVQLRGRSHFAVLGDRPSVPDPAHLTWQWHGPQVANVLFEDGHVRSIRLDHRFELPDHPFRNELGEDWAGLSLDDASLGISSAPPLPPRIRRQWLRTGRNNPHHPTFGPASSSHFPDESPPHLRHDR